MQTSRYAAEESEELATLTAGPGKAARLAYTAGRRLYPLKCPPWSDEAGDDRASATLYVHTYWIVSTAASR